MYSTRSDFSDSQRKWPQLRLAESAVDASDSCAGRVGALEPQSQECSPVILSAGDEAQERMGHVPDKSTSIIALHRRIS